MNPTDNTSLGRINADLNPSLEQHSYLAIPSAKGLYNTPARPSHQPRWEEELFDLPTYQYVPVSARHHRPNKFLVVQCRRVGLETRSSIQFEAVGQLNQYLSATHGRRHINPTPVYGMVAIGMYMRVNKYDDER
jgi:hypothetical protein